MRNVLVTDVSKCDEGGRTASIFDNTLLIHNLPSQCLIFTMDASGIITALKCMKNYTDRNKYYINYIRYTKY